MYLCMKVYSKLTEFKNLRFSTKNMFKNPIFMNLNPLGTLLHHQKTSSNLVLIHVYLKKKQRTSKQFGRRV